MKEGKIMLDIVTIQLADIAGPLYVRLAQSVQDLILKGEIIDGDKLPTIRELAQALKLNNSTVTSAYRYLEDQGFVYTKVGSGTYCLPENRIVKDELDILPGLNIKMELPEGGIDLAGNTPGQELFPVQSFNLAIKQVLDTDGSSAFAYQESEGFFGLRETLCEFSKYNYGIHNKVENIIITSGAQQAMDLISKVLILPGDTVFAENPSYIGARSIFKMRGAKIVGIPVDKDGINVALVEYYAKRYKPRLLYTMPIYQTPTGVCMSKQKRSELLRLSVKYDFYIIEDDILSDLNLDDDKLLPLKSEDVHDRVIYIKSFSKMLMPGIRTGYIIAPNAMINSIISAKYTTDISTSGLMQRALSIYLKSGNWESYILKLKDVCKQRCDSLVSFKKTFQQIDLTYSLPKGGLGVWVRLPDNLNDMQIYYKCLEKKVLTVPGSSFYISPMFNSEKFLRLSYATPNVNNLETGLEALYQSVREVNR